MPMDAAYADRVLGRTAIEQRSLPHSMTKIDREADEPACNPMTTLVTTKIADKMKWRGSTTFARTFPLSPLWQTQTMTRRDGGESASHDDYVGYIFVIAGALLIVASTLAIHRALQRHRHAVSERARDVTA